MEASWGAALYHGGPHPQAIDFNSHYSFGIGTKKELGVVDVNVLYHSVPELASRQTERAGSEVCTNSELSERSRQVDHAGS
jgi:hypothetical protein